MFLNMLILLMGSPANGQPNPSAHLFLIAGIFVIMYFFMIRPQSKKANEQRDFIANLQKGDKVVTIGGIHGKILRTDETSVLLEIDTNTKIRVERSAISVEYTKAARTQTSAGEEKEAAK